METITAPTQKTQRLRGLDLMKKLVENKRESREESQRAFQDPNSELSKAIAKLRSENAKSKQL